MDKQIYSYIYDFISKIFDNEIKEKIKEIILFGSVAKSTFDKMSDIDIFINIYDSSFEKHVEEELNKIKKSFEVISKNTWKHKNINYPISLTIGSLDDIKWKEIHDEISSSGILLYGGYKELPDGLIHFHQFYFTLNQLERKDKMRFIRTLYGYKLKKGKKLYENKGLLERYGGNKLSSNVILVPINQSNKIKDYFKKNKINYKIFDVWVRI
jgi:predicted nucleotidyltransferase